MRISTELELHRILAARDKLLCFLNGRLYPTEAQRRRVGPNPLALSAAEQFVDWPVEDLAFEVPKGNVDPAHGFHEDTLQMPAVHHESEHKLPGDRGFDWINAAQDFSNLADDRGRRLRRQTRHAFTDAGQALIRVHANQAGPIAFEDGRRRLLRVRDTNRRLRPGRELDEHRNRLNPTDTHGISPLPGRTLHFPSRRSTFGRL